MAIYSLYACLGQLSNMAQKTTTRMIQSTQLRRGELELTIGPFLVCREARHIGHYVYHTVHFPKLCFGKEMIQSKYRSTGQNVLMFASSASFLLSTPTSTSASSSLTSFPHLSWWSWWTMYKYCMREMCLRGRERTWDLDIVCREEAESSVSLSDPPTLINL